MLLTKFKHVPQFAIDYILPETKKIDERIAEHEVGRMFHLPLYDCGLLVHTGSVDRIASKEGPIVSIAKDPATIAIGSSLPSA